MIERIRTKPSREYAAYHGMKKRCYNVNSADYRLYGGRGIRVCDEWLGVEGFANFLTAVGCKPSPTHSLDRIDNDGDYEPGNVRWATPHEQARNQRSNWRVLVDGEWIIATDAAKRLGLPYSSMVNAMRGVQPFTRGWPTLTFRRGAN